MKIQAVGEFGSGLARREEEPKIQLSSLRIPAHNTYSDGSTRQNSIMSSNVNESNKNFTALSNQNSNQNKQGNSLAQSIMNSLFGSSFGGASKSQSRLQSIPRPSESGTSKSQGQFSYYSNKFRHERGETFSYRKT